MVSTFSQKLKNFFKLDTEDFKKKFLEEPIWKVMLQMCFPAFVSLLFVGAYSFIDALISITLAQNYYANNVAYSEIVAQVGANGFIRLTLASTIPVTALIIAFVNLFVIGASTRSAINLGRNNFSGSRNSVAVGNVTGLSLSFVLIPILILSSEQWIYSQYGVQSIAQEGFKYSSIIIASTPILFINRYIIALHRNEGKSKILFLIEVFPILINLLFDWIMMGALGLGIEGGAIATVISYFSTFILLIIYSSRSNSKIIRLRVFFTKKIRMISLIGIILVGISPFLRTASQALITTLSTNISQQVSENVFSYSDVLDPNLTINTINASVNVIYALSFPALFGFIRGSRPVAAFIYGAKNIPKLIQSMKWTFIYALITSVLLYIIFSFALIDPILNVIQIEDIGNVAIREITEKAIWISLLSLPLFSVSLVGMSFLGATDRIFWSAFTVLVFSLFSYVPLLFIVRAVLLNNSIELLFWIIAPLNAFITSLVSFVVSIFVVRKLENNLSTLDERLQLIYQKHTTK